jgi:type I restriction enzyme S subunit
MRKFSGNWQEAALSEVIETAVDGPFGSNLKTEHYVSLPGVRVIRLQNISTGHFDDRDRAYVSEAHARLLARHTVLPGDLLVASLGDENHPVARACVYPEEAGPAIVKADCFRLRPKPDRASSAYLALALNSPSTRKGIEGYFQGVTRDRINLSALLNFQLALPELSEQRRIVGILYAVDKQIRSTGRVLAKAEARERGLVEAALSEVGGPLEPISMYLAERPRNGYSPVETDQWTGTKALGLGCLTQQGFKPVQLKDVPRQDGRNALAILSDGDLLMSRANTRDLVGLAGIYRDIGTPCIYPDLMMRLTANGKCIPEFLELALRGTRVRRQIQAQAQGTSESMVKISSAIVLGLQVQIPEIAVQREVLSVVSACRSDADRVGSELRKLQDLRLGLVEDLLSGRVRG